MYRVNASESLYEQFQFIYDHFNANLFGGVLPECVFTFRAGSSKSSHVLKNRWQKSDGSCFHELAINSKILDGVSLIALCQTIVHEQCKILQAAQGTACRKGYHDTKWAKTMESIGLIPSHTGKPGGKKTGQKMSSYIDKRGKFFDACLELVKRGFNLEWIDNNHYDSSSLEVATDLPHETATEAFVNLLERKLVPPQELSDTPENTSAKRKVKYHCAACNSSVWGKPGLAVQCLNCAKQFKETA